jgi:peptidoglycan hydrolase-like protein with peptidoglycan-binding domain
MRRRKYLSSVLIALAATTGGVAVGTATEMVTAASTAEAAAPATIRYGDHNWSVVCLQQALNYHAYMTRGRVLPAGDVDGIFGPQTLASVRSFQVYMGRRVTGIVDRTTGEDVVAGLWYGQGNNAGIKDWLRYCQHTIPHYTQFNPT